jgi:hypothetical protein
MVDVRWWMLDVRWWMVDAEESMIARLNKTVIGCNPTSKIQHLASGLEEWR